MGDLVRARARRSSTGFEQRSCRVKVRLESRWLVVKAARFIEERGEGIVRPYRCSYCRGWHVGHPMHQGWS